MLPPTDISPRDLFLKLIERPFPSEVVPFPRFGEDGKPICQVRIRPLAFDGHQMCRVRAIKRIQAQFTPEEYEHAARTAALAGIIDDAVAAELLTDAILSVEPVEGSDPPRYVQLFKTADEVRQLSSDEVAALFAEYLMVQARLGPHERSFKTSAEVDAWVARIAEGAVDYPLALIGSRQRDELLCLLASRVSYVSKLLDSPPESWPTLLESLRTRWDRGMTSCSVRAADFAHCPVELSDALALKTELQS